MQPPHDAPEPSPAPTLASDFPGFFPKTPAADDQDPSSSSYLDALKPTEHSQETLQNAGKALLGAAAGFVVGGPIGAAVGGGLVGLSQVEREGLMKRSNTPTPTNSRPGTAKAAAAAKEGGEGAVDEAHRPEFGQQAIAKENHALADSPAQKLVSPSDDEGAHVTGAGALGGALLAGAAGAKVEENEVRSPTTGDDELERTGGVEAKNVAVPPTPDFGTSAVEKESAALATSPAQQLRRSDTNASSVTQAETALLAGAAGAKLAGQEVDEPARAPMERVAERSAEVGGPLGLASGEGAHAVPLEREISHPPSPSALHPTSLALQRPDLAPSHDRPSESSFAAAVLAAGEGVHTPTETGAGAYGGFGEGGRDVRASDRDGEEDKHVVHNPAPVVPAALAASAAGASLLGPESSTRAPQDFEPYAAPVVEQSQEAKVAVATPLPDTPSTETAPNKSFAPAILGTGGVYPNSPQTANNADTARDSTDTIPATVNAQNVAPAAAAAAVPAAVAAGEATRDGAKSPEEQIPMSEALLEGPASKAGAVPAPIGTTEGGETRTVPLAVGAEEAEKEKKREGKGKGKEVAAVAAGAGAGAGLGVLAGETLRREDGPRRNLTRRSSQTAPNAPALTSNPTSSTLDSTLTTSTIEDPATLSPLDAQRAFPPVPHFNRPEALNSTDEPVLDPSVDGAASPSSPSSRVLDPKVLAAESQATSPEQAGFTNVPPGGELTGAMQDFAHLSQPSKVAEDKALAEAGAGAGVGAAAVEPVETTEKREYEEGTGRDGLPLAAGAAGAGLAAGAVGGAVLARDHAGPSSATAQPTAATEVPPVGAGEVGQQALPAGAVATPLVAATAARQQPAQAVQPTPTAAQQIQQQPVATPVSRFTEQTALSPNRGGASGYDTPSSTRAVKGTPAASTTPSSSVYTGEATPSPENGSPQLPPAAAAAGVSPAELANVSLLDAGVIEQSKHMKIQTTRSDGGHKRLHRKSLSGSQFAPSARRTSLSQSTPIAVPPAQQQGQYYAQPHEQQQQQHQGYSPSGATGAEGGRPGLQTIQSEEGRRDRMVDDIVGVRDPTYAAVPSAATTQPRLSESSSNSASTTSTGTPLVPLRTSTPPIAPSAASHAHPQGAPGSPSSGANVGRKLSKRRPSADAGAGVGGEQQKKEGFFSRLMHGGGGGGHKRQSSVGSNTSPGAGSPRASAEQSRM
ncbi:hypothetical protein JCM6882_008918 [Rhodosporidiobolus microsporus]